MSNNNCCDQISTVKAYECGYTPPAVKKLLVRIYNGEVQVKVNGKGKWLGAELDLKTGILKYTA